MARAVQQRRKVDPDHKARFRVWIECACSCGWKSSMYSTQGARGQAAAEWHWHRDQCDKAKAEG